MSFGLTIYSLFYLRLGAHTVSWSLMGDKTHFWPQMSHGSSAANTEAPLNLFLHINFPFRFPSCLCIVDQPPTINPYFEKKCPSRQPLQGSPLASSFGSENPPIPTPHVLKLTGPETLAQLSVFGNCGEFSRHNSLVIVKSNYMFQMMKSAVMKSWHSSQGDRCIKLHGF